MHAPAFLTELVLLVAIAAFGVAVFERLRLPAIAGFLVMGALVGPGGVGLVSDPENVQRLAEFGVVFLLFEIGLEIPLDRLRRTWRMALGAGALQVGLTLAVVAAGAVALFGLPARTALVLGMLVAMSSTALVIRLLAERGELDAPHGQTAVGILLFQDLCIVPFLLAVPLLAGAGPLTAAPFLQAGVRALLAIGLFYAVARFAIPWAVERVAEARSRELFSLMAVALVLGAAVAAEHLGLTLAVGAFLAGLIASTSPYGDQLFAEVLPLRGVLLGIFFTAVGMLFEPAVAFAQADSVLLFVAAVVVVKAGVILAALTLGLGQGLRLGVLAALALAQTGEFSFVLAAVAAEAGVLPDALQQTFVAGSVLTLLATPFLMRAGPRVAAALARGRDWAEAAAEAPAGGLAGHAVLVGYGLAGRNVARVLGALGIPWVAVDANPSSVREARRQGHRVVFGDATRGPLLERVHAERARLVVVAISDPIATRQVVALARSLAPESVILVRAHYVLEVDPLTVSGANAVVAEEVEGTVDLLAQTLRVFGVPEGAIERFCEELRDEGYEALRAPPALGLDPWLTELLQQVTTEWFEVPESFAGESTLVGLDLRSRSGASVLAVDRGGATTPNPPPSCAVRAGDRLLLFGSPESVARARTLLAESDSAAAATP